jgi:hypothetical protein
VKAAGIETGIDFIAQKEKNNWLRRRLRKDLSNIKTMFMHQGNA